MALKDQLNDYLNNNIAPTLAAKQNENVELERTWTQRMKKDADTCRERTNNLEQRAVKDISSLLTQKTENLMEIQDNVERISAAIQSTPSDDEDAIKNIGLELEKQSQAWASAMNETTASVILDLPSVSTMCQLKTMLSGAVANPLPPSSIQSITMMHMLTNGCMTPNATPSRIDQNVPTTTTNQQQPAPTNMNPVANDVDDDDGGRYSKSPDVNVPVQPSAAQGMPNATAISVDEVDMSSLSLTDQAAAATVEQEPTSNNNNNQKYNIVSDFDPYQTTTITVDGTGNRVVQQHLPDKHSYQKELMREIRDGMSIESLSTPTALQAIANTHFSEILRVGIVTRPSKPNRLPPTARKTFPPAPDLLAEAVTRKVFGNSASSSTTGPTIKSEPPTFGEVAFGLPAAAVRIKQEPVSEPVERPAAASSGQFFSGSFVNTFQPVAISNDQQSNVTSPNMFEIKQEPLQSPPPMCTGAGQTTTSSTSSTWGDQSSTIVSPTPVVGNVRFNMNYPSTSPSASVAACAASSVSDLQLTASDVSRDSSTAVKIAVDQRPNLADMFEQSTAKQKGLKCKLLRQFGHFNKPIGCSYNESTKQWIVCDTINNSVRVYDPTSDEPSITIGGPKQGFKQPSAVAISTDMANFAIKDDLTVKIFDAKTFETIEDLNEIVTPSPNEKLMCLTGAFEEFDEPGARIECLVTMSNGFRGQHATINFIDPANLKNLRTLKYMGGRTQASRPRFMDWHSYGYLAISDLGVHNVYVVSCFDGSIMHQIGNDVPGRAPGQLNFPSGVSFDCDANLLVGDAKNNRVQFFNNTGDFMCVLQFQQPDGSYRPHFRFASDLHLTSDGELMVMSRSEDLVRIYKIEPIMEGDKV